MDAGTGRHRKRGMRGLVVAGVLIALAVGFLAGLVTHRLLLDGSPRDAAAAAASPSVSPAPGPATPRERNPSATGSPAPADPAPPGPQGMRAYLARLADEGLPVEEHGDVIQVLGRAVCENPPADRAGDEAAADRAGALSDDLLTREQTLQLVRLAAEELCGA